MDEDPVGEAFRGSGFCVSIQGGSVGLATQAIAQALRIQRWFLRNAQGLRRIDQYFSA